MELLAAMFLLCDESVKSRGHREKQSQEVGREILKESAKKAPGSSQI